MQSFIEKLEEAHEFPGPYTLKVIGTNDPSFVARVIGVTREVLELDVDPQHSSRTSRAGRHVSVTLELTVANARAVATLYENLQTVEGIAMLI